MKQQELKHALGTMPDGTRRAIEQTLDRLRDTPASRRKLRLAPVLALILALALFGTALAAMRDRILVYLLGTQGEASAALTQMVQPLDVSGTQDGMTLTVSGAMCDGERISFSFEAENADASRPAAVALDYTIVGEERIRGDFTSTASQSDPLWTPSFRLDTLPVSRNPAPGGMTAELQTPVPAGKITCTAVFSILRPKGELVVADGRLLEDLSGYDEEAQREYEDQRGTIYGFAGVTIAGPDQLDALEWAQQGYTVIDLDGNVYDGTEATYDGGGHTYSWTQSEPFEAMEKTGEIVLTFVVDVTPARILAAEDEIELDDCTARVQRLSVSPLSTHATVELIPMTNTREAAQALLHTYGWLELTDENGEPLEYHDMDFMQDGQGSVQETDGQWLCRFAIDMPGLSSMPDQIRLTMRADADEDVQPTIEQDVRLSAFNERMTFALDP